MKKKSKSKITKVDTSSVSTIGDVTYLLLSGEINDESVSLTNSALLQAKHVGSGVVVRIYSLGGDVDAGTAIYELLRTSKLNVTTEAYGVVGSIAVLIFAAGQQRLASPGSSFMLHMGSIGGPLPMPVLEAKAAMDEMLRYHAWYCARLGEASGQSMNLYLDMCKTENYFSAEKATEMGLASALMDYK